MADSTSDQPLLILVRDLMFSSRITAAADAAGTPFKVVRDPNRLAGEAGRRVIVDLNQEDALDAAAAWKAACGGEVVGFVSHVDTATIERARAAGIDRVLPRSRFVEMLPELVTQ